MSVTKTVRMGAQPLLELMADPTLDLRVIHLVRDPRGTLQSRMRLSWCTAEVCSDPKTVCSDLMADLRTAEQLQKKYPDRLVANGTPDSLFVSIFLIDFVTSIFDPFLSLVLFLIKVFFFFQSESNTPIFFFFFCYIFILILMEVQIVC